MRIRKCQAKNGPESCEAINCPEKVDYVYLAFKVEESSNSFEDYEKYRDSMKKMEQLNPNLVNERDALKRSHVREVVIAGSSESEEEIAQVVERVKNASEFGSFAVNVYLAALNNPNFGSRNAEQLASIPFRKYREPNSRWGVTLMHNEALARVREKLAENPATSAEILDRLAKEDDFVRQYEAAETYATSFDDQSSYGMAYNSALLKTREAVANNPNVSIETLKHLNSLDDYDYDEDNDGIYSDPANPTRKHVFEEALARKEQELSGKVHLVKVGGVAGERFEVVKPLKIRGDKTLIAYVKGSRVSTRWVKSDRISVRED